MRILVILCLMLTMPLSFSLPSGFVYLKDIAPGIQQNMRYATTQNFVGRPIVGYQSGQCILTSQAARALKKAQQTAQKLGYGLKVYDCYRPQMAVNDFYRWSQNRQISRYNPQYYPRVKKSQLFNKGYIARYSGHSRGSTVDLTLSPLKNKKRILPSQALKRCYAASPEYLNDNSIDMGTRFDCLDPSAHFHYSKQSSKQLHNKRLLRQLMRQAGFKPYHKEWWHFSLGQEPYPKRYFNFVVS